jgi:acyl-homoserine lactone acylase PvdQ
LRFALTAQRIYGHLPPADRARVDDYARGVNLFIAHCEQSHALPPEFRLLMYHPQPWTGEDSISVGLMMVKPSTPTQSPSSRAPTLRPKSTTRSSIADLIPGRFLARSSAHRHQGGSQRPATAVAALQKNVTKDDDENTEARACPAARRLSQFS